MRLFKKKKIEKEITKDFSILIEYIKEARRLYWTDEEIVEKFLEKNYPEEWIKKAFMEAENQNNERRLNKMEETEEDFEEEDFEESDEEVEEEEAEEEPKKKDNKVKKVKKKKEENPKKTELTNQQITDITHQMVGGFKNHEERITNIEASLFRMRGSI